MYLPEIAGGQGVKVPSPDITNNITQGDNSISMGKSQKWVHLGLFDRL